MNTLKVLKSGAAMLTCVSGITLATAAPASAATVSCNLPTLAVGSTGSQVAALQRLVHTTADGIFGPLTRAAVMSAQRSHGAGVDGIVGPVTWTALGACPTSTAPTASTVSTVSTASTASVRGELDAAVRAALRGRTDTVSVVVFDARTGAMYTYNGGVHYETASIVKVQILAAMLQRASEQHRYLTSWEDATARKMIDQSDNDSATALWNSLGGGQAVARNNAALGLTSTLMDPGGAWGLTQTTVADQVQLVRNIAYGSDVLSPAARAYARQLMGTVVSWQRWGVTGGVPAGVSVQLKNGWLPRSTHGWRVNSVGHVSGSGRDYVIAVLSMDNPTMDYGIASIEGVSGAVWRTLAQPLR